jgi:hypothetical protein
MSRITELRPRALALATCQELRSLGLELWLWRHVKNYGAQAWSSGSGDMSKITELRPRALALATCPELRSSGLELWNWRHVQRSSPLRSSEPVISIIQVPSAPTSLLPCPSYPRLHDPGFNGPPAISCVLPAGVRRAAPPQEWSDTDAPTHSPVCNSISSIAETGAGDCLNQ